MPVRLLGSHRPIAEFKACVTETTRCRTGWKLASSRPFRTTAERCVTPPRHGAAPTLFLSRFLALEHRPARAFVDEVLDVDEEATDVDVLPSPWSA